MNKPLWSLLLLLSLITIAKSQTNFERFDTLKTDLKNESVKMKGLSKKMKFSFSDNTLEDYIKDISITKDINFVIAPEIKNIVCRTYKKDKVSNILVQMCKEHNLDIEIYKSYLKIVKYREFPERKEVALSYNRKSELMTYTLLDDTLNNVLKEITLQSDLDIELDNEVNKYSLISGSVSNKPFVQSLYKLAEFSNLTLELTEGGTYLFKKKNNSNDSLQSEKMNQANFVQKLNVEGYSFVLKDSIAQKFITIKTENSEIDKLIKVIAEAAGESYFLFTQPVGKVNLNVKDMPFNYFLNSLLVGTSYTYRIENDIYLIGERNSEGLRETKVLKMKHRSFSDIENSIPTELKKGVEIKEFPELNSFILSGSGPQISEIEKITKSLDQVVPLIMIEVTIVNVDKGKTLKTSSQLGSRSNLNTSSSTGDNGGKTRTEDENHSIEGNSMSGLDLLVKSINFTRVFSTMNLGKISTNSFTLGIKALEEQNYAHVQSMPKLATLNSHKASMSVGETRYYSSNDKVIYGNNGTNTLIAQQWNRLDANLGINITPVVSDDDEVTLDINVVIADFIGDFSPNYPSPTFSKEFTSMIRVKNEELILLGGMETKSKSSSRSGVPVISRIPVLKWIFSNTNKSKGESLSYIFIRPIIVQ